jgi:hypothetical protein
MLKVIYVSLGYFTAGCALNVIQTGSRGFGLAPVEDIKEGDFITDYRGEVSDSFDKERDADLSTGNLPRVSRAPIWIRR